MKNQLLFIRMAILIWMFQSAFVAGAQVCIPSFTSSCTNARITAFTLKGLTNSSGCTGNASNYTSFPSSTFLAALYHGIASYPCTVSFGGITKSAVVFIDYNNDNDFLDAGELVSQRSTTSALGMSSMAFNFSIPATAGTSTRRLRVRNLDASRTWTQADACATLTGAGETEDYVVVLANSSITITSGNVAGCRGSNYALTWTTSGEFNPGNRFFAQFSNSLGSFSSGTTEINLSAPGTSNIAIPASLTPGGAHFLRVISTTPVVNSNTRTVSIPTSGCSISGITTLRIGPSNTMTACKGTAISIPFAEVNFPAGTIFRAQILPTVVGSAFSDIPGATSTTSPISAIIPFTLPQGDGYKIRVVTTTVTGTTSSTLLKLSTCLSITPTPSSICRGLSVSLPIAAQGIPAGTNIRAELSSSAGLFSNTSPVIIGSLTNGASNATSINVTVPCTTVNGTTYKIRLVPNSLPNEAGASTAAITINTNCTPFLSSATPASLFGVDAFCLGKTYRISAEIFAFGCFNAGNQFFVDFLDGSPTGPLVASVPVDATNGNYTIPPTMPLGANYFIRLRSTSPAATGAAAGEFPVEDCPEITLQSVCKVGNEYAVSFTSKGTFAPGNQFSVQFSKGGTTVTLGSPGTSSPLIVPQEGSGFPAGNKNVTVMSTIGGVSSNTITDISFLDCERPTITITALSSVPGTAGSSTSATVCPGGKLRIDFTTTGLFGTGNVFDSWLFGANEATFDFPERVPASPLIVELPTSFSTAAGTTWSVNMHNSVPSSIPTNSGILTVGTGCPTLTINSVSQSEFCNAPTISVGFVKTGTFNAANTFSVQLSDANGSFANPIDLVGSRTTSPITVSLPPQFIPNGTGYRLRLKSSDPALVGNSTTANRSKTGPVLTGPTLGFNPVGTVKTLTGTNLTGVNGVVLNNTSATFSVLNSTTINATIPNTTTGNWVVRKNGCVSNPILQLVGIDQGASASNPGTHQRKTNSAANGRSAVSALGDEVVSVPLQVFPNPSSGKILLQHAAVENARITIVNMMGQVILQDEMLKDEPAKNLDLIRFPAGIYLVKYQSGNTSSVVRLLKN